MFRLSIQDLARIRFAVSPSWELLSAAGLLARGSAGGVHEPWVEQTRGAVTAPDWICDLVALGGRYPDFLTPPPNDHRASVAGDLERIRRTPPALAAEETARMRPQPRHPALRAVAAGTPGALGELADGLARFARRAIDPVWDRVDALLHSDIARRARVTVQAGIDALLEDLHPTLSWYGDELHVDDGTDGVVDCAGRGLLLLPTAFYARGPATLTGASWQPTVSYPAAGLDTLWTGGDAGSAALDGLLGANRARVLGACALPQTTTRLAAGLGLSAGGVSRHLGALAAAGLLRRFRDGKEVLYVRTELGDRLLAG